MRPLLPIVVCVLACAHAPPGGRAVHATWGHSGIVAPRNEILLRDDGLVCLYDSASIRAGRIEREAAEHVFELLSHSTMPFESTHWRRVGSVPGSGGCDVRTWSSSLTIAHGSQPPRTVRVLADATGVGYDDFPDAVTYLQGDARLDVLVDGWVDVLLRAAEGAAPIDPGLCQRTGLGGGRNPRRRSDRRTFWPTERSW